MEKCFVGLDVSKDEAAVCVRSDSGEIVATFKKMTDPEVLSKSLKPWSGWIDYIVLETCCMANWLYNELADQSLPVVCIAARQAHAVLSQMHNKTDEISSLIETLTHLKAAANRSKI
ncbi:IS110 family transposase [Hoeflea sp.]|uniref:IS110 family transposase n=1 Tax=Hoeflea sp. TaxID=1940281 RepID=UPI003A9369E9